MPVSPTIEVKRCFDALVYKWERAVRAFLNLQRCLHALTEVEAKGAVGNKTGALLGIQVDASTTSNTSNTRRAGRLEGKVDGCVDAKVRKFEQSFDPLPHLPPDNDYVVKAQR